MMLAEAVVSKQISLRMNPKMKVFQRNPCMFNILTFSCISKVTLHDAYLLLFSIESLVSSTNYSKVFDFLSI